MSDAADELRAFARTYRRANAIDPEWVIKLEELRFQTRPGLAGALAEVLPGTDATDARYVCWLTLPAIDDADLPFDALARIADPDARVVATLSMLGRAASVPPALHAQIRATLAGAAPHASRNQEAVIGILQRAAESPEHFSIDGALHYGAQHFDARRYYEAHEAWEDVWRPMPSESRYAWTHRMAGRHPREKPSRDFFRGLIQLAVALKKAAEGNPQGTVRLLDRVLELLRPYEPAHRGIDIRFVRETATRLRAEALDWSEGKRTGLATAPPRLASVDIAAADERLTDAELGALLVPIYVGEGFTDPQAADEILAPGTVRRRGTILTARIGGALAGMVIVVAPDSPVRQIARDGEAELHLLAVAPAHRRAGIARRLLAEAVAYARSFGWKRVVLSTQEAMTAAQALYPGAGFRRVPARDWTRAERRFLAYEYAR